MTPKETTYNIGRRLAWARSQRGLSQGTVARLAGIAPSYLSRIETGKVQPTFRTVQRVAQSLKTDLRDIVGSGRRGPAAGMVCPISRTGSCMLDLVRSDARLDRLVSRESYSPREIHLLQQFARWMEGVDEEHLKAMELLLDDLLQDGGSPVQKRRHASGDN